MLIPHWALNDFVEYVGNLPPDETYEFTSLADYLYHWLAVGDGMHKCAGDREVFLAAFLLIADKWMRCPDLLDHNRSWANYPHMGHKVTPRRVDKLLDHDEFTKRLLDPEFFKLVRFNPDMMRHIWKELHES